MSRFDLLNHAANLLYVVAYFFRDILWLRIMVIAGCSIEIYYRFVIAPSPLWADIIWCSIFIVLNSYQLVVLIIERRSSFPSAEEKDLYDRIFSAMSLPDFKTLMKTGRRVHVPEQTLLIEENRQIDDLYLIVTGQASVIAGETVVSRLSNGAFAGEMSFLTGNLTSAKVLTTIPTQCIVWNKKELQRLFDDNENFRRGMYAVFNKDLINKVLKHTKHGRETPPVTIAGFE